jgi:uncharacterized protein
MPNPFAYTELHTRNPSAAKEFYRRLFDWRMEDAATPNGAYTEIDPGEGLRAGLKLGADADAPSYWLPYIGVADVAAATERAKKLGGRPVRELVTVPNEGRFSIFADPSGALFGLWEKSGG